MWACDITVSKKQARSNTLGLVRYGVPSIPGKGEFSSYFVPFFPSHHQKIADLEKLCGDFFTFKTYIRWHLSPRSGIAG